MTKQSKEELTFEERFRCIINNHDCECGYELGGLKEELLKLKSLLDTLDKRIEELTHEHIYSIETKDCPQCDRLEELQKLRSVIE